MKNKKGFTLIELLAVIVILAIIALIAVPVIMNIISNARKSAFKDTGYGIIKAGEYYYSNRLLDVNGMQEDEVVFTFPNNIAGLELNGSMPNSGSMKVTKAGKIALAITDGKYCVTKGLEDTDLTITEDVENCVIPVKITDMTITSGTEMEIGIGVPTKIEVSFEPSTATNTKLKYTSSDESIVTVDETGNITGVSSGTATITIETTDGSNIVKTINATVKQPVETFDLGTTTLSITTGNTYQIEPIISPDNASNKELTYVSSNTSVAIVSETGLITAVAPGTTTITVTTVDGSNISKTIAVTVRQLAESLTLNKETVTVGIGSDFIAKVTATVLPSNTSNKTLTWTSNDTNIATVSNGTIIGVALGSTTVTVTTNDGTNISKIITVNVIEPYENGIMQSVDNCINEGTCSNGTLVKVAVNDTDIYKFYVIADTGSELTLIMNQNLGSQVAWISADDYATANTDGTSCSNTSCTDEGPITAINALKENTSGWTNVTEREYTYSGLAENGTTRKYGDITETMRARMLTYSEAKSFNCTNVAWTCPSWLYGTTGYWLSTANSFRPIDAWDVNSVGNMYFDSVNSSNNNGVRPVIEITK